MILIIASRRDTAASNIAMQLLKNYPFIKTQQVYQENPVYRIDTNKEILLSKIQDSAIDAQYLPKDFADLDLLIFISRHSSTSQIPTLSVHTPGNFGNAELGGLPRKISISPANAMREVLRALKNFREEMKLPYEVSYECTHHGPSLDVPTMFVELGSSEKQWNDMVAAEAVAHATFSVLGRLENHLSAAVIGIGGPHYNRKFTRMALEEDMYFGHMIPKYAVSLIDCEILRQCVNRTLERIDSIILDWKGIRSIDKPNLLQVLDQIGLPIKKI